ncbi:uncharacterized protein MELLADRAFT_110671 [Melampsora larici-populina 98AG31]|uniref:Uncharacterized protein n=1 Tax=Melampsora larici-populina (strain 98AG31 / pathotype 3-4-7) TaxID=747676 RepID=F4S0K1_MELLP|nr:uncharacterized protein MELLADRAFT_110671 [Melampsora larici-populina 98AG31]EGG01853.1 hypothetical protein MELLADRAFT_110671 [Melampsora larici-populina 98AG31]
MSIIFSTLPTTRVKELNELVVGRLSQPAVLLTAIFHYLARSIDHVCAVDGIPRHDGTSCFNEKWDAGFVLALEGLCFPDQRGLGVSGFNNQFQIISAINQVIGARLT